MDGARDNWDNHGNVKDDLAFIAAMQHRPLIIVASTFIVLGLGFRWLLRNHPLAAIFLIGFLLSVMRRSGTWLKWQGFFWMIQ